MWKQLWLEGFPFVPFDFHVLFRSFHVFTFWKYIPQTPHKLSSWKIPPKKLLKSNFQFTHHNWKLSTPNNTKKRHLNPNSSELFEKIMESKAHKCEDSCDWKGFLSCPSIFMFCSVPFMFLLFENIYLKHPINFQVGKFHQRNFWSRTSNSHITTGNFQPLTTQKTALKS